MKIAIPFLTALLLVGGFVANGSADVLSKTEAAPGNYCHLRFHAITTESLATNHPLAMGPASGDIIDFYGPCDESPVGQHQIAVQKRDFTHRLQSEYSD